jgi:glutathione S-transferase
MRRWRSLKNSREAAMTKYQLVSFKTCPWVQRVAIVLREKKIDFEFQHIEANNRPDWFGAISPHNKVPVLRLDGRVSLFESGAIAEYLDETAAPRLHPEDPVERAINRAWIEYLPTFVDLSSGHAYAGSEAEYDKAAAQVPVAFRKLETALERQRGGPFFNGARYSLVDAAYAPFLQRHLFLERIRKLGHIDAFPRVKAWAEAIATRPSTHSFPPAEFEAMYRDTVKRRNKWISQFVDGSKAAAE